MVALQKSRGLHRLQNAFVFAFVGEPRSCRCGDGLDNHNCAAILEVLHALIIVGWYYETTRFFRWAQVIGNRFSRAEIVQRHRAGQKHLINYFEHVVLTERKLLGARNHFNLHPRHRRDVLLNSKVFINVVGADNLAGPRHIKGSYNFSQNHDTPK